MRNTRTVAGTRCHADVVTEQTRQPADDRKAQSQAARAVALRIADLVELLEHPVQVLGRDAGAAIPNLDGDVAAARSRAHDDAAPVRVTQRVRQQVAQDALEQHRVRADGARRRQHGELEVFLQRFRREVVGEAVEQRIEQDRPRFGNDDAGFELGDVEQCGKERLEGRDRRQYPVYQRRILRIARPVAQPLREESERMQRLPQVMARGGEEARLRAVGRFRGVTRDTGLGKLFLERLALLDDALLEARSERLEFVQRADEAVGQDPADQHEEGESGIGHEHQRPDLRCALRDGPVVHGERGRDRAGQQQQHAFRVPLAQRIAGHRRQRHQHDRDGGEAHEVGGLEDNAEGQGDVENDRHRDHEADDETPETEPADLGEAQEEQTEEPDEQQVERRPPDAPMRIGKQRRRQQRESRYAGPTGWPRIRTARTRGRAAAATAR